MWFFLFGPCLYVAFGFHAGVCNHLVKDNHLANMACWLKSAGALNFEL